VPGYDSVVVQVTEIGDPLAFTIPLVSWGTACRTFALGLVRESALSARLGSTPVCRAK
jgi:hypothetical protein